MEAVIHFIGFIIKTLDSVSEQCEIAIVSELRGFLLGSFVPHVFHRLIEVEWDGGMDGTKERTKPWAIIQLLVKRFVDWAMRSAESVCLPATPPDETSADRTPSAARRRSQAKELPSVDPLLSCYTPRLNRRLQTLEWLSISSFTTATPQGVGFTSICTLRRYT